MFVQNLNIDEQGKITGNGLDTNGAFVFHGNVDRSDFSF